MAPWGGVTLSTQSVSITPLRGGSTYYTTDGSTPSATNGSRYTAPFTITVPAGGTATVRAISSLQFGTGPTDTIDGHFRGYGFKPGDQWYSMNTGDPVQAFAGGVSGPFGGRYYAVGQWMLNGRNIEPQGNVFLYSSPDLYNWSFESRILTSPSPSTYAERSHILFNTLTSTYVLWAHCINILDTENPASNRACVATASAITGPWTWQNTSLDPDGVGFKDDNLFQDDNGTAYVVYTDGSQASIIVSQLSPDYLTTTGSHVTAHGSQQESPILFKRGSTYFLISGTSNLYTYQANINPVFQTAPAPLGPWSGATSLFAVNPVGTFYNGQPTSVLKLPGLDSWVYMADLWQQPVTGSTHLWLPLSFPTSTTAVALIPAVWNLP